MSEAICGTCGKLAWLCDHPYHYMLKPVASAVETPEQAHARGVAEERARNEEAISKLRKDLDYYKRSLEECHRDSPCRD